MKLNLKRPIIFFDLETTGLNISRDRIVEIAFLKIFPDGTERTKTYRVNPGIPIDPKATAIHGISDADVQGKPTFKELAKMIANEFEGCDIAGYNLNKFDIPLLAEEFIRAGVNIDLKKRNYIDVQVIFHKMEQRTLSAAYKFYCGKEHENAHSAEADTLATYEILKAQIERYENMSYKNSSDTESITIINDMDTLAKFCHSGSNVDFAGRIVYDEKGREIFNFGKYKGQVVEEVLEKDTSYYSWMMNGDFPEYTKKVLTDIRMRKMTKK